MRLIFGCLLLFFGSCQSYQADPPKNIMYPEADAKEKCPPEGNASRVK